QGGKTILLASHILSFVEEICDRVGVMHQGRLCAMGSVQEVKALAGEPAMSLEEAFFRLTSSSD
ncbi:MAG: ABC transporter ATP-binding protein, partial [Pyrinomonadaceae bacterium]